MSDEIKAATPAVDSGSNATTTDPRLDSLTDVIGEITNKVNNLTDVTNRVVNNMAAKVEEPEGESIDYADDPEAYFDRKLAVEREKLKKEIKQETKKEQDISFYQKKMWDEFPESKNPKSQLFKTACAEYNALYDKNSPDAEYNAVIRAAMKLQISGKKDNVIKDYRTAEGRTQGVVLNSTTGKVDTSQLTDAQRQLAAELGVTEERYAELKGSPHGKKWRTYDEAR